MSSDEVAGLVGVEPGWIERKTRIRVRRQAAPEEATSDLAARAAANALANAGIAPGSHALVVAADVYSRILDFSDRRTAVLFGDGAGAAVLGPVPEGYGILDVDLVNHRDTDRLIRIEAGSRRPPTHETVDAGDHFFRMDGRGVCGFVLEHVPPALTGLAERAGYKLADVDHFVPHQANGVMLDELVELSGLGGAHTVQTLERYGNVGSASVPVTLDEVNRTGIVAMTVTSLLGIVAMFTMPIYFQAVLGVGALGSGVRLMALLGGLVIGIVLGVALSQRAGYKVATIVGLLLIAGGGLLAIRTEVATGYGWIGSWLALFGAGFGALMITGQNLALNTLDESRAGAGGAIVQVMRQTGSVIGIAVLGSVLNALYRGEVNVQGLPAPIASTRPELGSGRLGRRAEAGERAARALGQERAR